MSPQLLRRAWNVLDSFKQAYPEFWNDEDEQVLTDLLRADLKLSDVKLKWVGLTDEEQAALVYKYGDTPVALCLETERKLKEKNCGHTD
jgi:hypothetical protein